LKSQMGENRAMTFFTVEDEPLLLRMYRNIFESSGHKVVAQASDGEEAVRTYRNLKVKPDIIIMDHRLPNMSGLQATRKILEEDPDAKIVFVSADQEVKNIALKAGAKIFLPKPVRIREIFENIEEIMK